MRRKEYSGGYEKQRITNLVATALPCSVERPEQHAQANILLIRDRDGLGFLRDIPIVKGFKFVNLVGEECGKKRFNIQI